MTLAIFVEGLSDKASIPILLRKLGQTRIITRTVSAGDMLDVDVMARHIHAIGTRKIDMVIIFRDSECTDPEEFIAKAKIAERKFSARKRKASVRYVIVDHSLEGWLGCDETALRAVLGSNAKLSNRFDPSKACRPAEAMRKLFRHNRLNNPFNKILHNQIMAASADPRVIAQKSPTFAYLVSLLRHSA